MRNFKKIVQWMILNVEERFLTKLLDLSYSEKYSVWEGEILTDSLLYDEIIMLNVVQSDAALPL